MIRTICGATAALALLAFAGASQAQVVSSVSVTTSPADPTSKLVLRDAQPCVSLTDEARNIASVQVPVYIVALPVLRTLGALPYRVFEV